MSGNMLIYGTVASGKACLREWAIFSSSEQTSFSAGRAAISESMSAAKYAKTRCSMNQKRQHKKFTDEFKNDAVRLVTEQGYSCTEVGRRLGISHTNISRWVREHHKQSESPSCDSGSLRDLENEVKQLRKENKRLLMEREILKKAAAFFANESN